MHALKPPDLAPKPIAPRLPWFATLALGAAIVVVTVLAYLPVITIAPDGQGAGFIWDDDDYVTNNPLLHDLPGLAKVWTPGDPKDGHTKQYYPLVFSTFWIEYQLWELDPRGYHLVNVLLHAANALLVWRLARRIGIPGGNAGAWLIGAVFALHPVHVESVAWITERKNVLSGLFYLLAMSAWLRVEEQSERRAGAGLGRDAWGWYGAALVLFAAALLSKTVTCSLPVVLILIRLYQRQRITIRSTVLLAPMFALGLALGLHTAHLERTSVFGEGARLGLWPADRVLVASKALLFYPWKLLWPSPLIFIYERWEIPPPPFHGIGDVVATWWPLGAVLATAALTLFAYRRGVRGPALALAFFAVSISPALGFIDVYPMNFSFVADHFQYLASLGVTALVIGGLLWLLPGRAPAIVAALLTLPTLFALTWRQQPMYRNEEELWRATSLANDRAWIAHSNLANLLLVRTNPEQLEGDTESILHLAEEARQHAARAVELAPDRHTTRGNLADALRLLGRCAEATEQAERVVALAPHLPVPHFDLGRLYQLGGRHEEAKAEYRLSLKLYRAMTPPDPKAFRSQLELAKLLALNGELDEATQEFREVLKLQPDDVMAMAFVADAEVREKRYAKAERLYRAALRTTRLAQEQLTVAAKLVVLLSSCPDPGVRNGPEALNIAVQLCRATNRTAPHLLDALAMAQAEVGQFDQAVQTAREARELARSLSSPEMSELASQIEQRIEEYRARRPWRQ